MKVKDFFHFFLLWNTRNTLRSARGNLTQIILTDIGFLLIIYATGWCPAQSAQQTESAARPTAVRTKWQSAAPGQSRQFPARMGFCCLHGNKYGCLLAKASPPLFTKICAKSLENAEENATVLRLYEWRRFKRKGADEDALKSGKWRIKFPAETQNAVSFYIKLG